MARPSKKEFIVEQAAQLFLQQGYKGTSIDTVVAQCKVSKPTVYNHFPDKQVLMDAVMDYWLTQHPVVPLKAGDRKALIKHFADHWWVWSALDMYRLVIGEGYRFQKATDLFWSNFDEAWRKVMQEWANQLDSEEQKILEWQVSHELWTRIKESSS